MRHGELREMLAYDRAARAEKSLAAANAEIERLREAIFGKPPEPGLPLAFVLGAARLLHDAQKGGQETIADQARLIDVLDENLREARSAMTILAALTRELSGQVLRYSTHQSNCGTRYGHDCDCGLDEARRAAIALLQKDKNHA